MTVHDQVRAGDLAALEALLECHASTIYRVAHGITRSQAGAEAVLGEVLIGVARGGDAPGRPGALRPWIYRATVAAARARCRSREGEALERWLPRFRADGHREGHRAALLADWSGRTDGDLLARGGRAALERVLGELPPLERSALLLRDVEGLSLDDTIAALDEPAGAVRAALHRARMALREALSRLAG
jgi:RNA polymerase sigma-70 factor (ECF subfamily)